MKNIKKVLVTGGAGFIGSHIVDELLRLNYAVIIIDNFSTGKMENVYANLEGSDNDNLKVYRGDIRDMELLGKLMKKVDYVIHQAALANVPESISNPIEYNDVNVTGTLNILECARKNKIKKVVLASSSSVENISSPYGLTKWLCEEYAQLYYKLYGLETICLRYYNVYGERQSISGEGAVIPTFITKLLKGERPDIHGDGEQTRDFIYVKDVARVNVKSLHSHCTGNFNIGSGIPITINQLYVKVQRLLGNDLKANRKEPRVGDVRHSCATKTLLAYDCLNWKSKADFDTMLKRTTRWYKNAKK